MRFGAFEADLHSGELRKAGTRIRMQDQPFKVLQILLERPGEIVTRDELQARIWPEESFGDFDHAVNIAVGKLRAALGDSAESPAYIETLPRRGYRFVGEVESTAGEIGPAPLLALHTGRAGPSLYRLLKLSGVAVTGLFLVGLGILLGRRNVQWQSPKFQRVTVNRGTVYSARFAPDGQNIIYAAAWNGAPIEVFATDPKFPGAHPFGLSSTELLAVSSSGEMAVLHPVGQHFLLTLKGTLGQVPLGGGSPRSIAENIDWADWAPHDGKLAVVRELNGKQQLEYPIGRVLYETTGWISHLRFSLQGDQIAFLDHPVYGDDAGAVAVINLAGQKRILSRSWESIEGLTWAAGGNEVWFSAAEAGIERNVYAVNLSGRERLVLRTPGGTTVQDVAPDGRVLLTRDEHRVGMMAFSPADRRTRELSWRDWSVPTDISKDGNTVLFEEEGLESGANYTTAVRDLQGSPPTPLGEGASGSFSPDGKWVTAVVSSSRLFLLPTGAGTAKQLERGEVQHYCEGTNWMPDGKQLIFPGNRAGHPAQCFIQSVDTGSLRPLAQEGVTACQASPDGNLVAVAFVDNSGWLFGPDGTKLRPISGLGPGENFGWTDNSRFLYVYNGKQIPVRVYRLNVDTGQRRQFLEIAPQDVAGLVEISHLHFSSDQQAYVYSYTRFLSELYLVTGIK